MTAETLQIGQIDVPRYEFSPPPSPETLHDKACQIAEEFGIKKNIVVDDQQACIRKIVAPISNSLKDQLPSTIITLGTHGTDDFLLEQTCVHLDVLERAGDSLNTNVRDINVNTPDGVKTLPYDVVERIKLSSWFGKMTILRENATLYGTRKDLSPQGLRNLDKLLDFIASYCQQRNTVVSKF